MYALALIVLMVLSGCAAYKPTSQKILDDYTDFSHAIDKAVEAGKLDPTQALIIQQQAKIQSLSVYEQARQLEGQQTSVFLGGLASLSNKTASSNSQIIPVGNRTHCYSVDGGRNSYCG